MARFGLTGVIPYPHFGYYNGTNASGLFPQAGYGIGRYRWDGGDTYVRDNPGPTTPAIPHSVLASQGSGAFQKTPRALRMADGSIRLYGDFAVHGPYDWKVALCTAPSETGAFTFQGFAADPNANHCFQVVIEDPDDVASRRFKMWISDDQAASISYWYSATGLPGSFTKHGNVIVAGANGQAWEYSASSGIPTAYILPSTVLRVDGEWLLFYSARYGGAPGTPAYFWRTGLARFINPESTYTNRAQVPSLDNAQFFPKTTTLTAAAAAGATTVQVATTSPGGVAYQIGDPVTLGNQGEYGYSIDYAAITAIAGNTITLSRPLQTAKSAGAAFRDARCRSVIPTYCFYDPTVDKFRMLLTTFEEMEGVLAAPIEDEVTALADNPWGPFTYRAGAGIPQPNLPRVPSDRWDGLSAENNAPITDARDPVWSLLYTSQTAAPVGRSWGLPYGVGGAVGRSWALPFNQAGTPPTEWPTRRVLHETSEPTEWPTRRVLLPGDTLWATRRRLLVSTGWPTRRFLTFRARAPIVPLTGRWAFVVCDRYGNELGELQGATQRKVRFPLRRTPTIAFTVQTDNRLAGELRKANQTIVKAYETSTGRRVLRLVAEVASAQKKMAGASGTLAVTCAGLQWRLAGRLVGRSQTGTRMGTTDLAPLDRGQIAAALIDALNAGDAIALTQAGDTGIRRGAIAPTAPIAVGPWVFKPADEALAELAAGLDGFDWEVAPVEPLADALGVKMGELNVAPQFGGVLPDVVWEAGAGRRNVVEWEEIIDGAGMVNDGWQLPVGWPDTAAGAALRVTDASSVDAYRLRESVIGGELGDAALREQLLREHVRIRSTPRQVYSITPAPQLDPDTSEPRRVPRLFADYNVGDVTPFRASELASVHDPSLDRIVAHDLQQTVDGLFRIYVADVNIDDNDVATVTLTITNDL